MTRKVGILRITADTNKDLSRYSIVYGLSTCSIRRRRRYVYIVDQHVVDKVASTKRFQVPMGIRNDRAPYYGHCAAIQVLMENTRGSEGKEIVSCIIIISACLHLTTFEVFW